MLARRGAIENGPGETGHHTIGDFRLDGCEADGRAAELEFDVPLRRRLTQRLSRPFDQLPHIDVPSSPGTGMNFRREIEIVDRAKEQPCLRDDFTCAATVSMIGGTKILALDDLGEADNG